MDVNVCGVGVSVWMSKYKKCLKMAPGEEKPCIAGRILTFDFDQIIVFPFTFPFFHSFNQFIKSFIAQLAISTDHKIKQSFNLTIHHHKQVSSQHFQSCLITTYGAKRML